MNIYYFVVRILGLLIFTLFWYCVLVLYLAYRGSNYVPTPSKDILRALTVLSEDDIFIDLGFGYGEVLEKALQRGAGKAIGYELDPLKFLVTWIRLRHFGNRLELHLADIWTADLRHADMVFTFFAPALMAELFHKAKEEMKKGAWFVSFKHVVPAVKATKRRDNMYFYRL